MATSESSSSFQQEQEEERATAAAAAGQGRTATKKQDESQQVQQQQQQQQQQEGATATAAAETTSTCCVDDQQNDDGPYYSSNEGPYDDDFPPRKDTDLTVRVSLSSEETNDGTSSGTHDPSSSDSSTDASSPHHHHHHHHNKGAFSSSSGKKPRTETIETTSCCDLSSSPSPCGTDRKWTEFVHCIHRPILRVLQRITRISAHNPKCTVMSVVSVSLLVVIVGLLTNFQLALDDKELWTPVNSYPDRHMRWINDDKSGFPDQPRLLTMFFHDNGRNVLGSSQVADVFEVIGTVRKVPGLADLCQLDDDGGSRMTPENRDDESASAPCRLVGVTDFWNNSYAAFEERSAQADNRNVIRDMSQSTFPDGRPVAQDRLFGYPERNTDGLLTSVQSYTVIWLLPPAEFADKTAMDVELGAVEAIQELNDGSSLLMHVEVYTSSSKAEEYRVAVFADIPLVPVVFVVMSIFTCLIFFRRHKIYSRCLLGFGAVVTVMFSIMGGFGVMFVCGVPFSTLTQLLLFVVFGIGMDDAFILFTSYQRTDHKLDPVQRIAITIDDIGMSITLTTFTSTLAFALGCLSSLPAVVWLCLYAVSTIILVLFYQLTLFVALIVLDERRIMARRRDCCFCCQQPVPPNGLHTDRPECKPGNDGDGDGDEEIKEFIADRFMAWYSQKLLKPWVKPAVIAAFSTLFALCVFSTASLKVQFKLRDMFTADSHITSFWNARDAYTGRGSLSVGVYFRYVDQSDPQVQAQMESFIDDLTSLEIVRNPLEAFWLTDFRHFVNQTDEAILPPTFEEQLALFLSQPVFNELYGNDIVLNNDFEIMASRTFITMDVDVEDAQEGMSALEVQRNVTTAHPANQGRNDFAFFTYERNYNFWEFYAASVDELIMATTIGVAAMTCVALVTIPHWTAAVFVLVMICVCYIDLLGAMQWGGLDINPVSYLTLVMSIGLLVDYLLHVLLRYYEEPPGDRRKKTKAMLQTMGASILTGGCSTLLGVLPLAFSQSQVFYAIFMSFLAIVSIGVGHGLILLPVLLSILGPEGHRKATSFEV